MRDQDLALLATSLRRTLEDDGIAVVRTSDFSSAELIAFCRTFGTVEKRESPFFRDYPEIYPNAHSRNLGHVDSGRYWHADGAWHLVPVRFSFLYAAHGNFSDNATCFVRTDRVFERMDEPLQAIARRIVLKHPNGAVQPIVRRDGASGIEYLHLNEGLLSRYLEMVTAGRNAARQAGLDVTVMGAEPAELSSVLQAAIALLDGAPDLYRHSWRRGDLLAVDNLKFLHKALPFGSQTTRVLYRVCVFA